MMAAIVRCSVSLAACVAMTAAAPPHALAAHSVVARPMTIGVHGIWLTAQQEPPRVLATVNGLPISRSAYERMCHRAYAEPDLGQAAAEATVLGMWLHDQVLVAFHASLAQSRHLAVTDTQVDARIRQMCKEAGDKLLLTDAGFQRALQAQGVTEDEFRAEVRVDMLAEALEDSLFAEQNGLTEKDLRQSFDEVRVRHILIGVNTSPTPIPGALPDGQALALARKVARELAKGAPFATLARKYSGDSATKNKGGELGWGKRYGMSSFGWVKPFADAAFLLKAGRISAPIRTDFGYHIIQVERARHRVPADYGKRKAALLNQLRRTVAKWRLVDVTSQQFDSATIVWNDEGAEWRYLYATAMPGDPAKMEGLLTKLRVYTKSTRTDTAAAVVLTQLLSLRAKSAPPAERDALNNEIVTTLEHALTGSENPGLRVRIIEQYLRTKQTTKAVDALQQAHQAYAHDTTAPTLELHRFLAANLSKIGLTELAAEEAQAASAATEEKDKADAAVNVLPGKTRGQHASPATRQRSGAAAGKARRGVR